MCIFKYCVNFWVFFISRKKNLMSFDENNWEVIIGVNLLFGIYNDYCV